VEDKGNGGVWGLDSKPRCSFTTHPSHQLHHRLRGHELCRLAESPFFGQVLLGHLVSPLGVDVVERGVELDNAPSILTTLTEARVGASSAVGGPVQRYLEHAQQFTSPSCTPDSTEKDQHNATAMMDKSPTRGKGYERRQQTIPLPPTAESLHLSSGRREVCESLRERGREREIENSPEGRGFFLGGG